jgi:serine/threonine protein kinase
VPETLRQLINRGPVDPSTALSILGQLLKALEFAHWRGVVFGDIAPESVVITSVGEETSAHFGYAHAGDDFTPTQADTAMAASEYLAPEQISGYPADERTDIFALGVVAYEMLTGKHPFGASDGLSASSVMDRILHAKPLGIPEATLASLPRHIPPVLAVALAKSPEDRFPDAVSFSEALREPNAVADVVVPGADMVVPGSTSLPGEASSRVSRPRRKWLTTSIVGGLVVVALVVGLLVAFGGNSGLGSSTTVTSRGTSSTGQSGLATATTTTATSVVPTTTSTTIASTTTTIATTTIAVANPTRYEQTESRLVYAGTWRTDASDSASGSSFVFSDSGGASVSVTFEGTNLAWIAKKAPAYGKAKVTLDGKSLGTVDLYSASTRWQQKVWGTGTLNSGLHTVTIARTGTKNTAATGTNINVDAFDVVGSVTQAP